MGITAQRPNCTLAASKLIVISRLREVILAFYFCDTPAGELCLAFGPQVQERHGLVRVGPEEEQKKDQSVATPLLWTKAETVGVPLA